MSVPAATRAFDRLARSYDGLAQGELFRLQRARTHAAFARSFQPGHRVLEIGCGTGIDTAFLAQRGVCVVACDPSEEMVSRSMRRLETMGLAERTSVLPCGLQGLVPFLDAFDDGSGFDGIVSNFGALNCVECLEPLGAIARQHLRTGGTMILGLINHACLFENVYFALTGRRALVGRRSRSGGVEVPVAGIAVPTFYHRLPHVRGAIGADLELQSVTGIGVAVPPPYFEPRWQTLPSAVRHAAAAIDTLVSTWPAFNRLGDHVLLTFVKEAGHD